MPKIKVKKAGAFVDLAPSVEALDLHSSVSTGYTETNYPSTNGSGVLQSGWQAIAPAYVNASHIVSDNGISRFTVTIPPGGGEFAHYGWNEDYGSYQIDGGAIVGTNVRSDVGGYAAQTAWFPISEGLHVIDIRGVSVAGVKVQVPQGPYAYSPGVVHFTNLNGNETVVLTGTPAGASKRRFVFKQDATGDRTITWPSSVVWAGGTPVPSKAANSYEVYELTTVDGGINWVGSFLQVAIPLGQKGVANGVATLDGTTKIPLAQIPAIGVANLSFDPATQAELNAVSASLGTILPSNITLDAYTLGSADVGTVVEFNRATAVTVTVPTSATDPIPVNSVIELWQQGAGQVTIVPEAGVTIRSPGGLNKIYDQYSGATLRKRDTNEWVLQGDLA